MSDLSGALVGGGLLFLILLYIGIFIIVWAFKPSRVLDCNGCVDLGKVAAWSLVPLVVFIVLGLVAAGIGADGYSAYQHDHENGAAWNQHNCASSVPARGAGATRVRLSE